MDPIYKGKINAKNQTIDLPRTVDVFQNFYITSEIYYCNFLEKISLIIGGNVIQEFDGLLIYILGILNKDNFENNTFKFLPTELLENQSGPPAPLLPARQWAMVTHIYRFTAIGNVYNKAKFELVIDSPLNSEDELKKLMNEQIDGALKDQLLLMDLHGKFIGYMADPTVELTPLQVSYPVGNEPPDVTPETMWTVRDMRKYPAFI